MRDEMERALLCARNMDWTQVVMNGGPPCFHIEGGHFCGRAKRWDGHQLKDFHEYVSLHALLQRLANSARANNE